MMKNNGNTMNSRDGSSNGRCGSGGRRCSGGYDGTCQAGSISPSMITITASSHCSQGHICYQEHSCCMVVTKHPASQGVSATEHSTKANHYVSSSMQNEYCTSYAQPFTNLVA